MSAKARYLGRLRGLYSRGPLVHKRSADCDGPRTSSGAVLVFGGGDSWPCPHAGAYVSFELGLDSTAVPGTGQ